MINRRSALKNLSGAFVANMLASLVSILLVLILPKFISISDYSYWQLYLLYVSFVGVLHLGLADGVYLRQGGKEYKDLDKRALASQFWLLCAFEAFMAVLFVSYAIFFMTDVNKSTVIMLVALNFVLMNLRTFLQMILQGTNRILAFSKNLIVEKLLFAFLAVVLIVFGKDKFEYFIFADIFAKTLMLVLLCYTCKDIILAKKNSLGMTIDEAVVNVGIGINLVIANIAGILIIGVTRLFIENAWNIETFGKVSLTLSVANLVMVFISATSIVLFPIIKRAKPESLPKIYTTLRTLLMAIVLGALILYYPAHYIFSLWLPHYADVLIYAAILFPVCVYEAKMSMLILTYLKALRKERYILAINVGAVMLSVLVSVLAAIILKNLALTVLSIVVVLAIRATIAEVVLSKLLKIRVLIAILSETLMTAIFIVSAWFLGGWMGLGIYVAAYGAYVAVKRGDIIKAAILLRGTKGTKIKPLKVKTLHNIK